MGKAGRAREKARERKISKKNSKKSSKKELSVAATNIVASHVLSSVTASSEMAIIHRSNPNPRKIGLYSNRQRILLVGEGDFSFAASLATALGGERIVATSLDSLSKVLEKYGTSASTSLSTLRRLGAQIAHRVDALDLSESLPGSLHEGGFDRVAFNFPHVGGATAEDVAKNQKIVREFARSACSLLRPGPIVANSRQTPQVHVTLRATPFYQSWDVGRVAEESGQVRLVKTVPFDTHAFQALGYTEVRTNPATRDAPSTIAAETYIWESMRDPALLAASRNKTTRKTPPSKQADDDDDDDDDVDTKAVTATPKRTKLVTSKSKSNRSSKNLIVQQKISEEEPVSQDKSNVESKRDDSKSSGISHSKMSLNPIDARMKTKTKTKTAKVVKDDNGSYEQDVIDMQRQSDALDELDNLPKSEDTSFMVKRALEKKLRQIDSLKARPRVSLNEGQKAKLSRESVLRAELAAL